MISLKILNNIENMFPSKILRYIPIDSLTVRDIPKLTEKILDTTIGFFGVIDKREVRHCVFIFQTKDKLEEFISFLNKEKIDYTNNALTYRNKCFLRDLLNENAIMSNIDL